MAIPEFISEGFPAAAAGESWNFLDPTAPSRSDDPNTLLGAVASEGSDWYSAVLIDGVIAKLDPTGADMDAAFFQFPAITAPIDGWWMPYFIIEIDTSNLTKATVSNIAVSAGLCKGDWDGENNPATQRFYSCGLQCLYSGGVTARALNGYQGTAGGRGNTAAGATNRILRWTANTWRTGVLKQLYGMWEESDGTPLNHSALGSPNTQVFSTGDVINPIIFIHTHTGTYDGNLGDSIKFRVRMFLVPDTAI